MKKEYQDRIEYLKNLPEDWYIDLDGSLASLPSKGAISTTETVIEFLEDHKINIDPEDIGPDANGGTGVVVNINDAEYWFRIYNDSTMVLIRSKKNEATNSTYI